MKQLALVAGILVLFPLAGVAGAAPDRSPSQLKAGNPVVQEMRILNDAMKTVIEAVANNRLDTIPPAIHRVHEARQQTEKAIESRTYRLPKNADRLEGFIQADEAFHEQLVTLLKAAKANDLMGATRQVGPLMISCTNCHQQYRF